MASISDIVDKKNVSSSDVIDASAPSKVDVPKKKVSYNIDDIFTDIKEMQNKKGLRVLLWGSSGVGKTYAAMSFPSPIYVLDTDGGVVQNYKYYKDKDIKVVECYDTMPRDVEDDSLEPFNIDPVYSLEKFDHVTQALVKNNVTGTIIVDTISDVWSWIGTWLDRNAEKQVSGSGKEYLSRFAWGDANNRYDWIMKRFKNTNANVVFIARAKDVYDGSGNITGRQKEDAQKKSEYHVDYKIRMTKRSDNGKLVREAFVEKSRGADIADPKIENFSYDTFMDMLKKYEGNIS